MQIFHLPFGVKLKRLKLLFLTEGMCLLYGWCEEWWALSAVRRWGLRSVTLRTRVTKWPVCGVKHLLPFSCINRRRYLSSLPYLILLTFCSHIFFFFWMVFNTFWLPWAVRLFSLAVLCFCMERVLHCGNGEGYNYNHVVFVSYHLLAERKR